MVSYISDPLYELAWGTLGLFDDVIAVDLYEVAFDAEGGGIRLQVRFVNDLTEEEPLTTVLSLRLEDLSPDLPHPPQGLPHEVETTAEEFGTEVLRILESVYDRHGVIGYRERWLGGDFPVAAMVRLRHELGLPPVERRLWYERATLASGDPGLPASWVEADDRAAPAVSRRHSEHGCQRYDSPACTRGTQTGSTLPQPPLIARWEFTGVGSLAPGRREGAF